MRGSYSPKYLVLKVQSVTGADLDKLKIIKPLYCSLTWNYKNKLACGCNSRGNLTKLGLKYIERIEKFNCNGKSPKESEFSLYIGHNNQISK